MKIVLSIVLLFFLLSFLSCKKCATCTSFIVGPDGRGGIKKDTVYRDNKFCGESLDNARKENGKYYEVSTGSGTNRFTTIVACKD